MALVRTAYTQHHDTDGGNSTTVPSLTIPNGELAIVIAQWADNGNFSANTFTISDAGAAGLTFTAIGNADGENGDFRPGIRAWRAVGNGSASSIVISKTAGQTPGRWLVRVYSYTGFDATTPIGALIAQAAGIGDGALSVNLNAAPAATSEVLGVLCGTLSGADACTVTHGAGWSEINDFQSGDWFLTQIQSRTGSTSQAVAWADIMVGNTYYRQPAVLAFEIKAAASGQTITHSSATTAAVYGSHTLSQPSQSVSPSGIASAAVYGTHAIADAALSIVPSGLASAAVFGTHSIAASSADLVTPTGVDSAAVYGSHTLADVALSIVPSGIGSAAVYGSHTMGDVNLVIAPSGIASSAVFGSHVVVEVVESAGVPSAAVYGTATIFEITDQTITPTGVDSAAVYGSHVLGSNLQTITHTGKSSAAVYGSHTLANVAARTISPSGVASAAAFGTFSIGPLEEPPPADDTLIGHKGVRGIIAYRGIT